MSGKIITIAQQKGGSGKTTLTANLAVAFARNGRRVAILDTDPQGSLGRWYMARREYRPKGDAGLGFRTASAWGARYEARELLKDHDIVLIDTPPKMGVDGRPAIEAADLVIVPVTPSYMDVWATEPTIALAQAEKKPVLLVLNRASSRTRLAAEMLTQLAGMGGTAASTIIGNRIRFAETMGTGSCVADGPPSDPGTGEVAALAEEVMRQLSSQ